MKIFSKQTLLDHIKPLIPSNPIIVEAGAFDGKDTKRIAEYWPKGSIHAFEPVPNIFDLLISNTKTIENVVCHQYALSNKTASSTFYLSEHPSKPHKPFQAGSLEQPYQRLNWSVVTYNKTIQVPTITLDQWALQHKIKHIDLMWLDVQGHALPILASAEKMLSTIHVLYLEVEFIQAYKDQAIYPELTHWLQKKGFVEIGRDFTNTTDWFFGNVLFLNSKYKA